MKSEGRRRRPPRLDPELLTGELREAMRHLDELLRDLAGGEGTPAGFDPALFLAPGVPRVRPLLVILSARAAGLDPRKDGAETEHVAAAAELLHLALLVHDAAFGRRGGRRRRVAKRILGSAVGVLGGSHLTLRALELARVAPAPDIIGDLLDAMREIADGQARAQRAAGHVLRPEEFVEIADGRTGAVFAFACRSGGRLAGADRRVVHALGRYGRHTGVAWQLAEDLAALDPDALVARAADGAPSYALAVAAARDPAVDPTWRALRRRPEPELGAELARRLARSGAIDEGRRRCLEEAWRARRSLAELPASSYRDTLDRIAAGIMR